MTAKNRIKLLPYLLMNLFVAVSFQNCKQSTGSLNTNSQPELANNISEIGSDNTSIPIEDPPVTVGTFPGETQEITLFSPKNTKDNLPLVTLTIVNVDPKLAEAQFNLGGDLNSVSIKTLTCTHSFKNESEDFDCTNLDRFIVENLKPGTHRLRVTLSTTDDENHVSQPVVFTVPE